MLNKIIIPLLIAAFLIAIQFFIVPFIAVYSIIPNIVLIFVILYSLRFGQLSGTFFGFLVGLIFDIASAGLIGSGMFAFTLSSFIAGYFYKEDYFEVIYNVKLFLLIVLSLSTLFFILYTVLGMQDLEVQQNYNYIIYSSLCGLYTTIIALVIFIIPKGRL